MSTQFEPLSHGIRTVSIVGAGTMGRGIAMVSADAGLDVRVSDIDTAIATRVVEDIKALCQERPSPHKPGTIRVAGSDVDVADADLVIEAVAEDIEIKSSLFAKLEPLLREDALLASNSSGLPMCKLGATLSQPHRFCGLHFCHPVPDRPLVEVIGAEATSHGTLARIHGFAQSIGMSTIAVRDTPGFLLNRLLVTYLNEAMELALEGVDPELINREALNFGLPAGPFAQLDEFGIDVALEVGKTLYRSFPDRILPSSLLIGMYKAGRLGRKSGNGFYFENGQRSDLMAAPASEMLVERGRMAKSISTHTVKRRLFLPMLLEATRALEESVVDHPAVVDQALRDGLGMTERYAGLFSWADAMGANTIIEWLDTCQPLGKRFEPTDMLRTAARNASTDVTHWGRAA